MCVEGRDKETETDRETDRDTEKPYLCLPITDSCMAIKHRGFVYERKLTALTHYYQFLFVKELVDKKKQIETVIREFFDREVRACAYENR